MNNFSSFIELVGRILLAFIFIKSGYGKVLGYEATQAYMATYNVSGNLLPLVILIELGGGLAIILGVLTRIVASFLAVFCLLTAFFFHSDLNDQIQFIMLLKNVAIAGGFLILAAHGAGKLSIDYAFKK